MPATLSPRPKCLYQLGLDAGSDSLGWAAFLLDERGNLLRLLDGGVRLFDGGRDPQKFESKAGGRGVARRARRRFRAKAWRRDQLKKLLAEKGVEPEPADGPAGDQTWTWRALSAREPLDASRLATVLLHLCRHRGFKSLKLSHQQLEKDREKDESRWKAAETALEMRVEALAAPTVGALLAHELKEGAGYVRARHGDGDVPTRPLIHRELLKIREIQRASAPFSAEEWDRIEDLILEQRPIRPPPVGGCTLIPGEPRAPKALPTSQRARIRMALANLRVIQGQFADARYLTQDEWEQLTETLDKGGTHTWPALRKLLGLPRGAVFSIERLPAEQGSKTAGKQIDGDLTGQVLGALVPGWNEMSLQDRDGMVERLLEARRNRRRLLALADEFGVVGEARIRMADEVQFGLPRGAMRLSKRALSQMVEELSPGITVREIENRILGQSEEQRQTISILDRLPSYEMVLGRQFGNVTVHIALGQIRHLVNALVERWGHPQRIVIETTREMKASADQLRAQRTFQSGREKENQKIEKELSENRDKGVTRVERLRRWRLWTRQGGVCPYTGEFISKADIESAIYSVDHVVPRSIGGSDSFNNLVLCYSTANARKKDWTPWQAFHDQSDWPVILKNAEKAMGKAWEKEKWRFGPDAAERVKDDGSGWAPRQIIDTSHVAKAALAYLRHICPDVIATRGASTAWLRAAWDINIPPGKVGENGPRKSRFDQRHHFVDAAVIGVTSRAIVQRLNTLHSRHGMLPPVDHSDVAAILDEPFPGFADQVTRRWHLIWPSRRPDHGNEGASGELHRDTLYRALPHPDDPGKLRRARRRSLPDLFGNSGDQMPDSAVSETIRQFVSPDFAKRFWQALEAERGRAPTEPLATLAHRVAAQPQFGPRGIGRISVWEDDKAHDPESLDRVRRGMEGNGTHHAIVDAQEKAYLDIVCENGKWTARPVSVLDSARSGSNRPSDLVMRLHKGDLIAWEPETGKREVGWLRVIKATGQFFVWPLRVAPTIEAARALSYDFPKREGVSFSAETLRTRRGRPVTVTILGRLRDPGFVG